MRQRETTKSKAPLLQRGFFLSVHCLEKRKGIRQSGNIASVYWGDPKPSTSSVIEKSVKAFAKDITKFLEVKRAKKIVSLQKAAKGKKPSADEVGKTLVSAAFVFSKRPVTQNRTPEMQAGLISAKSSWTCASAHMIDMARHVDLMYGPAGKKAGVSWDLKGAFGSKAHHFATLSEVKKTWTALMKTHGLKNYAGTDGWSDKDSFHFELPESKVPRSDPLVAKCLIAYSRLTRIDGKQRNPSFETGTWKGTLTPYLKKAEAEKAKADEATRAAELAKLTFAGSLKDTQKLLQNANRSGTGRGKPSGSILPASQEDTGKVTEKAHQIGTALVWDSLARSIFEKLGLSETKGFDVKLSCGVKYTEVKHQYLSQAFIRDLTPNCALIYNTPAAPAMKMSVTAITALSLSKSGKGLSGSVRFDVVLATPLDKEEGVILVTFKDNKATASAKLK